jgi:hypothetical protein
LQPGARELSYCSTPPRNAKYLISRIENFLIHVATTDSLLYCRKPVAELLFVQQALKAGAGPEVAARPRSRRANDRLAAPKTRSVARLGPLSKRLAGAIRGVLWFLVVEWRLPRTSP